MQHSETRMVTFHLKGFKNLNLRLDVVQAHVTVVSSPEWIIFFCLNAQLKVSLLSAQIIWSSCSFQFLFPYIVRSLCSSGSEVSLSHSNMSESAKPHHPTSQAKGEKSHAGEFGYVGIDAILEQMRRKAMKQGFELNIMVVGKMATQNHQNSTAETLNLAKEFCLIKWLNLTVFVLGGLLCFQHQLNSELGRVLMLHLDSTVFKSKLTRLHPRGMEAVIVHKCDSFRPTQNQIEQKLIRFPIYAPAAASSGSYVSSQSAPHFFTRKKIVIFKLVDSFSAPDILYALVFIDER